MLSYLRRGGFIQFVMVAIVMLIIAAFAFDYRVGTGNLEVECVVRVAGRCVPAKDFHAAFRLALPSGLEPEQIRRQGLRKQVIDGLVERELLLLQARELGIGVSEDELDNELEQGRVHYSLPVAQHTLRMGRRMDLEPNEMVTFIPVRAAKNQDFDFKIYKRSVMSFARMSTKDFKEKQRDELVAARMRALIGSHVRVAETEAFAQFTREGSKAVARIAHVQRDWFARFTVLPNANDEQAFASKHAAEVDSTWEDVKALYTAGCADLSEIVIDLDGASDEERAQAKKKLSDARARIVSAEDFAMVARALSTRPSAQNGGRIGCKPTEGDPEAQQAAEAIAALAPGKLSEVLESDGSLRLVRLNARLTEAELTNVGRQILLTRLTSEELARQAAQQFADQVLAAARAGTALDQAVTDRLTQVIDAAALPRQHRDALREAALASEAKPRVEISSSFSPSGNPLPGATGGSPAQQLFALQNADDLHPTPVTTHDGLAVLQLKEKTPATREDFETRKNDIIRELRLRKQSDAVVSYVKRLRDAMQAQIQIDARFLDETQSPAEDG